MEGEAGTAGSFPWHSDPPPRPSDPPQLGIAFARFCWNKPIVQKNSVILQRVVTAKQCAEDRDIAVGRAVAPLMLALYQS